MLANECKSPLRMGPNHMNEYVWFDEDFIIIDGNLPTRCCPEPPHRRRSEPPHRRRSKPLIARRPNTKTMELINQNLTRSFEEFKHLLNQSEEAFGKRFLAEHAVPQMVKDRFLQFANPTSANIIENNGHDPTVSFEFYLSVKFFLQKPRRHI